MTVHRQADGAPREHEVARLAARCERIVSALEMTLPHFDAAAAEVRAFVDDASAAADVRMLRRIRHDMTRLARALELEGGPPADRLAGRADRAGAVLSGSGSTGTRSDWCGDSDLTFTEAR